MHRDRRYLASASVGMCVAMSLATVVFTVIDPPTGTGIVERWAATASALAACAGILVIRRVPWVVLTGALLHIALDLATSSGSPVGFVLLAVGCGAVGAWGRFGVATVPLATVIAAGAALAGTDDGLEVIWATVLVALVAGLSVAIGLGTRRQERIMTQLRAQHEQLAALQRRETEAALVTERARIARELHDVVAHHVSALLIQAQAAQRQATLTRPAEAARWQEVTDSARLILHSMRRLVGLLRTDRDHRDGLSPQGRAERSPQPTLADLAVLAERTRRLGLDVALEVPEQVGDVSAEVQLAGYRIAQEAVTNVLRHASATRALVRVSRDAGALLLDIEDDGQVTGQFRAGNGLIGMRERAASLGGHLDVRASPGCGLRVHAWLPPTPDAAARHPGPRPARYPARPPVTG
ncbi:MAG: sensor histidine kinase [Dermatophilaceae bacterium]